MNTQPITSVQPITLAAAEAQQQEIRRIMAEQGLNFGPAIDEYIIQREHLPKSPTSNLWESADD